jgi:hypothetical protein
MQEAFLERRTLVLPLLGRKKMQVNYDKLELEQDVSSCKRGQIRYNRTHFLERRLSLKGKRNNKNLKYASSVQIELDGQFNCTFV